MRRGWATITLPRLEHSLSSRISGTREDLPQPVAPLMSETRCSRARSTSSSAYASTGSGAMGALVGGGAAGARRGAAGARRSDDGRGSDDGGGGSSGGAAAPCLSYARQHGRQ